MPDSLNTSQRSDRGGLVVCAASLAALGWLVFFHHLGGAALFEPDEGRNAEVAREILLLTDWVTPHYDFVPYLDKPIFFFWLVAGAFKAFGVSEASARLPSALAAVGCVVLVYDLARTRRGPMHALWSCLVLVTTPVFVAFARATIFDMTLTFFVTLAIWAFMRATAPGRPDPSSRNAWIVTMCAAMGCATLAKGPVGFVLPALVAGASLVVTRNWSGLRSPGLTIGLALSIAIVAPWYVWAESRNPGYLRYFFLTENVQRFLTPVFRRPGPWYYYLVVLVAGWFPWSLLIPELVRDLRAAFTDARTQVLCLWVVVPLVFFSLSESKLPGYVLPIFPPLAVLMGDTLTRMLAGSSLRARLPLVVPSIVAVLVVASAVWALSIPDLLPGQTAVGSVDTVPLVREIARPFLPAIVAGLVLVAAASLWAKPNVCYVSACVCGAAVYLFALAAEVPIAELRSSRRLAAATVPFVRPGDQLAIYDGYFSSLPFYLSVDRPIWVGWPFQRGQAMGSSYMATMKPRPAVGDAEVLLTGPQFAGAWNDPTRRLLVFVEFPRLGEFRRAVGPPHAMLLILDNAVLITNR
jgi:4-amino-4-deoxy-L-arabinose transferase-like glycosyltransferase